MRKYPSQEDCQMLVDLFNRESVYNGACSDEFRKYGDKANAYPKGFITLWNKAFGAKSPWNVQVITPKKGHTKRKLFWDKNKAALLNL